MSAPFFVDPQYDFPERAVSEINYVVCSLPRSGSNFLGTLLRSTERAGFPAEYFSLQSVRNFATRVGTEDYLSIVDYVRRRRTSPNGVFGFKAHYDQFVDLGRKVDIDAGFAGLKYIRIHRRDVLGQAISFARAAQSGRYTSAGNGPGASRFDPDLIESCMSRLLALDASWRRFFARRGLPVLEIAYEDLIADPAGTLISIGEFLGLGEKLAVATDVFVTKKQGDASNAEWRRRILEIHRSRRFPEPDDEVFWMHGAPIATILSHLGARIGRKLRKSLKIAPVLPQGLSTRRS